MTEESLVVVSEISVHHVFGTVAGDGRVFSSSVINFWFIKFLALLPMIEESMAVMSEILVH